MNPRAPAGPILMPQYHNASSDRGTRLNAHASAVFDRGTHARETGEKYVRTTVLLATVPFLIVLSQRFGPSSCASACCASRSCCSASH